MKWEGEDECTVVHPDYGILLNTKEKWAIKPWKKHGENLKAFY